MRKPHPRELERGELDLVSLERALGDGKDLAEPAAGGKAYGDELIWRSSFPGTCR